MLRFQAFSWYIDDGTNGTNPQAGDKRQFTVHTYGKTETGESVALHVTGFQPSFCVKYDASISTLAKYKDLCGVLQETRLVDWRKIGNGFSKTTFHDHLIDTSEPILSRRNAWGFNPEAEPFFEFKFSSLHAYHKALRLFQDLHMANTKRCFEGRNWEHFYQEYQQAGSGQILGHPGEGDDNGKKDSKDESEAPKLRREWNAESARNFLERYSAESGISVIALKFAIKLVATVSDSKLMECTLFDVVDPILRFVHVRNLPTSGWIDVKRSCPATNPISTCKIELDATYDDLFPYETDMICAKICEMAFDIESYSFNDLFPDPRIPQNYVYQIGITIKHYGDREYHRKLLHFNTPPELRGQETGICDPIADIPTCLRSFRPVSECENEQCVKNGHEAVFQMKTDIITCDTEAELLLTFRDFIVNHDPDLIYGYNSDVFDWDYLMTRAEVVLNEKQLLTFCTLSRDKTYRCKIEEAKFSSAAYGDNRYRRVDIPGRLNIDLMIWIQRNMPSDRYPSFSLDTVAGKEIDEQKRDIDVKDIFQAFRSGNPRQLAVIGDYCCQDTVLVQKLVNKLDVVTQMFEMAKITDTPPMYLMQKGQEIKCFSQITKEAREHGFLVPLAKDRDMDAGKFKGAIVLEPKVGMYDTPVAILDFASLYPSIQMAYNVCYTTIVLSPELYRQIKALSDAGRSLQIDNVQYELIEWEEDIYIHKKKGKPPLSFSSIEDASEICTKKKLLAALDDENDPTWERAKKFYSFAFAQQQKSIIPELQRKMKAFRKRVKVMMAKIEHSKTGDDQLRYRVLNGRQLAIKVSMNSLYGFTSAFKMHLRELAACVTAKGRLMIEQTRDFMEGGFCDIAKQERWTTQDYYTYFMKDGKEVSGGLNDDNTVSFKFRDQQVYRSVRFPDDLPSGWIPKYPSAQPGKPWTDRNLNISVVGGGTLEDFHFLWPISPAVSRFMFAYANDRHGFIIFRHGQCVLQFPVRVS